jgi:hypothetical protein
MNVESTKVSLRFIELQKQITIDCLNELLTLGNSRDVSADILGIPRYKAYKLLRYGLDSFCGSYKRAAKERDNYTCQHCFLKYEKGDAGLHAHHIGDPTDHSEDNLLSLCVSCHMRYHRSKEKNTECSLV